MILMWIALAQAGEVEAWKIDDFGHEFVMAGTDGWTAGYSDDPWYAYDGRAYSLTDDSVGNNFSGYGDGTAADNWLIRGTEIEQGSVRLTWGSDDDDTLGLIANHNGRDSFYLLFYSEHSAPPPVNYTDDRPELVLLRVENGTAKVLKRIRSAQASNSNVLALEVDAHERATPERGVEL